MKTLQHLRGALLAGTALACGFAATEANAGAFGVREQSAYFQGMGFAGSAAGGDISSMFWNPAATASLPGFNTSTNITAVFGHADEKATGGTFFTGVPAYGIAGLTPTSTDVGTEGIVPSSYMTYQVNDRVFLGLGMNAPQGFITKPDNLSWTGSPVAITSKVFSIDLNPTVAYKLTPTITIGAGVQIEYFKIKLTHGNFDGLSGARSYDANDWGLGVTAGVIWTPTATTTIGLGYRSSVAVDVHGAYKQSPAAANSGLGINASANGSLNLPDQVTFSVRQEVSPRLALLGTAEWQNWSRVQNVTAFGAGCLPGGGTGACETLNLNYRDGWLFSVGAEYALTRALTVRGGIGWERSPITDSTRDILLPDSDRWHLSAGATYRWSDKIGVNIGYSHLFFEDNAPFCIASAASNGGSSHCKATTLNSAVLLRGNVDAAVDILSVGINYQLSAPVEPLK